MYKELFKLRDLPFRLSPDPDFLFRSKNHSRAKAYMESTIWFTDGFVVLTGEIGAGKTTLIESFLRELEQDVVIAQVNQTQVNATEFLQSVLAQFGFKPFKMKKAELLATLNTFLIEQFVAGRKVLLIVDEAQNLPLTTLEEIRMLSGVETSKEKVLRIILAGQPELNDKIDSPELIQLAQRVRLRFHLAALTQEEMRAYILHRLDVAGADGRTIFAEETYPLIYRYSGGVPRLVNTLCETAMTSAYTHDSVLVRLSDVEDAIQELGWVDYARRTRNTQTAGDEFTTTATGMEPAPRLHVRAESESHAALMDKPLARVVVITDGRTMGELSLRLGRTVIGRTPDNDLQIESRFVSRHHCQIITKPTGCSVEDLNSTNGIVVHAKRVRQHHLRDGDVITIGKHDLVYIDERGLGGSQAPVAAGEDPSHGETHVL
ncbi:MAG: AAA family ATPase [Steroidobacteraceae bacterium]